MITGTGIDWKNIANKTVNISGTNVVLYEYKVTANTTLTVSNTRIRNIFFNFSATNFSLIFQGTNIILENCVFNVPRNEGDGVLFFNITSGGTGVLVKNCVFRNTALGVGRVELIGVQGMVSGSNIVCQNNSVTLNFSTQNPSANGSIVNGWLRNFFSIPSVVTADVLGNIYLVDNKFEDIGLVNGNAGTFHGND